jgi:UDP-N-acetylmuramate: L-alanyl-gamma-D-glutamyl-meso-diaminopimelate ligase
MRSPPWGGPRRLTPFVIEADEYDTAFFDKRSKFVHYRPRTAVLNNLEFDHADIFDDLAAIERQFHHLVRTVPSTGRLVVNGTEESLQRVLAQGCWSELRTFRRGGPNSDFRPRATHERLRRAAPGRPRSAGSSGNSRGVHNQMNALAAIAAAQHVGVHAGRRRCARWRIQQRQAPHGSARRRATASPSTTTSPTTPPPSAPPSTACAGRPASSQRILAVFEPRSNTMKLGVMKAQLPWSLEAGRPVVLPRGRAGLGCRRGLAPMGDQGADREGHRPLVAQVKSPRPSPAITCCA